MNENFIEAEINPAVVLLDFIRKQRLTGTKEGCKEGDCGACTVLCGEISGSKLTYKTLNSCLLPLGNIQGKHIVTIEGLSSGKNELNPVQEAFVAEGASQCGFCTPGFIVSMTCYFLNPEIISLTKPGFVMDGNICRCTGHNSIIRAAEKISSRLKRKFVSDEPDFVYLTEKKIIPEYFLTIKNRLKKIDIKSGRIFDSSKPGIYIGGGTDLFVQKPDELFKSETIFLHNDINLKGIEIKNGNCEIGSSTTVSEILNSGIIRKIIPGLDKFGLLFGSAPIRNNATIGGNINNASPIGDMTSLFMALDSVLILTNGKSERDIPLKNYFSGYKKTERHNDEYMKSLKFRIPEGNYFINFEKVSKRTYLDIASVNSSLLINIENGIIASAHMSAGGVSAVPLYLKNTSEFLTAKKLCPDIVNEAVNTAQLEISPISDARGSSEYKRLLLSRLIYAHFITLFPEIINIEDTYERL
ncbi:MAG: FAD binding domain-containing protein [Ignavibacteria bacterium]|nr:FAD binding domain-containing protein [Ignavibacteria bacterium]